MRIYILITLLCCTFISTAQISKAYYPDSTVKVYSGTRELTLAWAGGFNNPQFAMGDLNHDGLPDLVVYEPSKMVKTFINKGTTGNPDYRYAPEYALNFPPVSNYLVLADYNCDNIPDLFQEGGTGFSVYRGYYNSSNRLCFSFYKDIYYNNDPHAGGAANAYNNPGDIPAIVDVDNDGDLDFVSYDINGGFLNLYKNMRVEYGLPCDSIHIELKDRCWGKVSQIFYRTHFMGTSCDNTGLKQTNDTAAKQTHSGNTPCLFDWDMDGDYDYLDGSVSFNEMTFLKNGRIEYGGPDSMVYQDTMWQSGGTTVSIPIWPAAFNVDIDQDGKKDLLISPNAGNASENYKCIWFYKNMTTPGAPDWQFKSDTFLIDKTIDAGTASYPMLFDYNKDGKPDLFVGSDGFRQSTGLLKSRIAYYENTSTTGHPSFTLRSLNFLNIDTFSFQGAAPTFGDIDNDGKTDMILGHSNGTLTYYKNIAASETVQPIWQPIMTTLTNDTGGTINVSGKAAPFIYDIDKDGKKDLVIGNTYGTIQYYRNVSTVPGSIKLKLINNKLGNIKADPNQLIGCYSTPFIGRIDSTGRDYLLMGSNSGNIYRFDSVQSGDTTLTYPMIDTQYSSIDSTYTYYNHPYSVLGLYDNIRSSLTVGDVDGDGDYEMITGNILGGLNFYKRKLNDYTGIPVVNEDGRVNVYPNPTADILNINWSGMLHEQLKLTIINMQGQQFYSETIPANTQHTSIDVNSLTTGIYVCIVQSGVNRYYNKFTVLR